MTRYLAQRILTGEWLDRDLPLSGVTRTRNLSGPSLISASLTPELRTRLHDDGLKVLEEWATFIYAADDDLSRITHCGIFVEPTYTAEGLTMNCPGYATYPHGYIYDSAFSWGPAYNDAENAAIAAAVTNMNAQEAAVASWQSAVDANPDDGGAQAGLATAQAALVSAQSTYDDVLVASIATALTRRPDPIVIVQDLWAWMQAQPSSNLGVTFVGDLTSTERIGTLDEPYRLRYWEIPDIGEQIDTLTAGTPFDYAEEVEWSDPATKRAPARKIRLGFPRLGTNRPDLRFVEGENVVESPTVAAAADALVNDVIGVGKGEGSTMVWARSGAVEQTNVVRRNLIPNPSFEYGLTGWEPRANCTISLATGGAVPGRFALEARAIAAGEASVQLKTPLQGGFPAEAGAQYAFTALVQLTQTRDLRLGMGFFDAAGAPIGTAAVFGLSGLAPGIWHQMTAVPFTAPAGTAYGRVHIYVPGAAAGETFKVDRCIAEKISTTVPETVIDDGSSLTNWSIRGGAPTEFLATSGGSIVYTYSGFFTQAEVRRIANVPVQKYLAVTWNTNNPAQDIKAALGLGDAYPNRLTEVRRDAMGGGWTRSMFAVPPGVTVAPRVTIFATKPPVGDGTMYTLNIDKIATWPDLPTGDTPGPYFDGDTVAVPATPGIPGIVYSWEGAKGRSSSIASQIVLDDGGSGIPGVPGDGRLRRTRIVTDKAAGQTEMNGLVVSMADRFRQPYDVTSVVIRDHPNARLSSINLGDDILVQAFIPALGDVAIWVRVLAISEDDTDQATLTTSRSTNFLYAPEIEV